MCEVGVPSGSFRLGRRISTIVNFCQEKKVFFLIYFFFSSEFSRENHFSGRSSHGRRKKRNDSTDRRKKDVAEFLKFKTPRVPRKTRELFQIINC